MKKEIYLENLFTKNFRNIGAQITTLNKNIKDVFGSFKDERTTWNISDIYVWCVETWRIHSEYEELIWKQKENKLNVREIKTHQKHWTCKIKNINKNQVPVGTVYRRKWDIKIFMTKILMSHWRPTSRINLL